MICVIPGRASSLRNFSKGLHSLAIAVLVSLGVFWIQESETAKYTASEGQQNNRNSKNLHKLKLASIASDVI
jgi:hypothetical protein